MTKKKIVLVPLAGLGNRMRVLASSIAIAKRDKRELYIAWPINSDVGCSINDVFKDIGIEYKTPSKLAINLLTTIYRVGLIRRLFTLYKFISKRLFDAVIFDGDIVDYKTVNKLEQIKSINDKSTVLIASCLSFSDEYYTTNFFDYLKDEINRKQFNDFVFNDTIISIFNKEYAKISLPYVGIHVRRTDNFDTIQHGSDANYINEIDKLISTNKEQKFFLATDSELTKKYFKNKYGSSIHTVDSILERNSIKGIQAGVVEMLLLSKSSKMICSIISSYSNAAALIGNIKEIIYVDTFLSNESV